MKTLTAISAAALLAAAYSTAHAQSTASNGCMATIPAATQAGQKAAEGGSWSRQAPQNDAASGGAAAQKTAEGGSWSRQAPQNDAANGTATPCKG